MTTKIELLITYEGGRQCILEVDPQVAQVAAGAIRAGVVAGVAQRQAKAIMPPRLADFTTLELLAMDLGRVLEDR